MRICGWLPLDRPSPSFQIFYPWPRAQTISPGTSCSCPSFWSWLLSIVASGLWHFAFIPWGLQVEVSLSLRAAPLEESTWVPVTLQSWLRLKCWRVSLGLGAPYDIVYDEAYFGNVEMADRKFVSTEIPMQWCQHFTVQRDSQPKPGIESPSRREFCRTLSKFEGKDTRGDGPPPCIPLYTLYRYQASKQLPSEIMEAAVARSVRYITTTLFLTPNVIKFEQMHLLILRFRDPRRMMPWRWLDIGPFGFTVINPAGFGSRNHKHAVVWRRQELCSEDLDGNAAKDSTSLLKLSNRSTSRLPTSAKSKDPSKHGDVYTCK